MAETTDAAAVRQRDRKHLAEYINAYSDGKWTRWECIEVIIDMLEQDHAAGIAEGRRQAAEMVSQYPIAERVEEYMSRDRFDEPGWAEIVETINTEKRDLITRITDGA